MSAINCKGRLLSLDHPVIMGILNITSDSFYQGFKEESLLQIVQRAGDMMAEGASIIDIGGQSTRPGSTRIHADEESQNVIPVITALLRQYPDLIISIDTYYSEVAQQAIAAGAAIVNDISFGDLDPEMISTVAQLGVPYIGMHMQGRPENMQEAPSYKDVTQEVLDYLIAKTDYCKNAGIKDIIIDPGFGFGKTIEHNFSLLKELQVFTQIGYPVLAGLSRKGMIYRTLDTDAAHALNGTTALNMVALMNGAKILRVHDVGAAAETIKLFNTYKNAAPVGTASA